MSDRLQSAPTLRDRMAGRRKALEKDPDCVLGVNRLDRGAFESAFTSVRQHFITYLSFENYRHALMVERARFARLLPDVESGLQMRASEAMEAYRHISASSVEIGELLRSSGLAAILERNLPSLLEYFYHDPVFPQMTDTFREMGATEGQISWIVHLLAARRYDILRFGGGDGTFAHLIGRIRSDVLRLEKSMTILKTHGLVTFEGASGDGSSSGEGDNPAGGPDPNSGGAEVGVPVALIILAGLILLVIFVP